MRRTRAVVLVLASVALAVSCSDDEGGEGDAAETTTSADDGGTLSGDRVATTTTALPGPSLPAAPPAGDPAVQTPPVGTNGLALDADGNLWIADGQGNQVLHVDASSGEILARWRAPEDAWPDDIALDEHGRVFWTGFMSGEIGRIDPATEEHVIVATLPPGANPISFTEDGRLFVGLAVTDDAIYEVDPSGLVDPRLMNEEIGNVNGFDVAEDGHIYGPRANGEIVRIDWESGVVTEIVATGLGFPAALKEAPDGSLYVLSAAPGPPTVKRVDIGSGEVTDVAVLHTQLADNLVVAGDGTIYVTTFDRPVVLVVAPDAGDATELTIGTP